MTKKLLKCIAAVIIASTLLFGAFAPSALAANGEYTKPECEGLFQDLTCTSLDHVAAFMSMAYEIFADMFLEISPSTFDYEYVGSPGHALHEAWNGVRGLANTAFVILLFIVIISQITGIGISNYGIKKMLPRMIAGILIVNLSYLICQGAIDLANIFGASLGSLFEDLMIDSMPPDIGFSVGNTALTSLIVGIVSFLVIRAKGLGMKIILLVALGIIAIVIAVFLLIVIAVVRQALCILLVVFSPIAFVCYMLPGTKSIFNRWFSMFKGVLVAYPICSLLIYGGSYAGAVIYGAWTDNGEYGEVLRNLSFLLIATVPYFFIPSVIMKSLGAAEGAIARLGNFLQKNGRGAASRTRFMTNMQRRADQDQQLARAGYKRRLNGEIVPKKVNINASDGRVKKMAKRAYNASLRARNAINPTAPYVKNAVRIQSEERRANAYRKKLKDMTNEERSNFYVFNASSGKYEKVSVPLTNRQIRKGMVNGQRIYRSTKANPDTSAGSSHFVHTSNGDVRRIKETVRARRLSEVTNQEQNLETAAWRAQIKNDNLGVSQISDAIKKMSANAKNLNTTQLSAYTSALIADGAAGREALEELLRDNDMQQNVDAIKNMVNGMTKAELNSIKKKNPILHNKIMAIKNDKNGTLNVGDLSIDKNFAITEKQLDGLSPKHLAEMDASAQKRVVEDLLSAVEADPKNIHDAKTIKALALAEGALDNPEVRATMSPEQVANLEQIKNIRRTAVEAEAAKTIRSDRAAMEQTAHYASISPEDVGKEFRKDFKNKFLTEGAMPGGNNGVLEALAIPGGCDTTRMEAITKAANAQLDEILRGKGLVGAQLKAARDDIMRGVMQDMDSAIREKSKKLIAAMESHENSIGTSSADIKAKGEEMQHQFNGATSLCDVLTQRINLR